MSIINDALKKAGQPVSGNTQTHTSAAAKLVQVQPVVEKHRRPSRVNWGPFFVVAIVAFITGPIIAPLLKGPYVQAPAGPQETATKQQSMGQEVSSNRARGQFAIEEAPLPSASILTIARPSSSKMPRFALSGLVYSQAGSYCLINGKVLKVGESVGGATVQSISQNEVVLNYEGSEVRLASAA